MGSNIVWPQKSVVKIDTEKEIVNRKILCQGTGWPLEDAFAEFPAAEFVGTVTDGPYMWHIFDTKVEEEIKSWQSYLKTFFRYICR